MFTVLQWFSLRKSKVFKPGLDRTVRPKKPWTVHFCGSFSIKNRSMSKKQGPVLTAVGPHGSENRDQTGSHGSLLPIEFEPKKKTQKRRKGRRRRWRKGGAMKQPIESEPKIKKLKKKQKRKDNDETGVAPWSNCSFFFCFSFLFFLHILLLLSFFSSSSLSVSLPLFFAETLLSMWSESSDFSLSLVFVMTWLHWHGPSIGNIENFLSSPRVYSTWTLAA